MYMQVNGVRSIFNTKDQNQQLIFQKTLNTGPVKFRVSASWKKDQFKFLYRSSELGGNAVITHIVSMWCYSECIYLIFNLYIILDVTIAAWVPDWS